ncbi:hypothetical protein P12x_001701 [Tundrisphaera lichenicola]|uniref:hypothetical protein n=1 Tax=Tundrisphaera lichenicola TaxID=2029860 RepID=UPI003EBE6F64
MRGRPGSGGGGDQDDRVSSVGQSLIERRIPADLIGPDHEGVGLSFSGLEEVEETLADRVGVGHVPGGHHDDPDPALGDRFALGGRVEGVDPVVFLGRWALEIRGGPHRFTLGGLTNREISDFEEKRTVVMKSARIVEL